MTHRTVSVLLALILAGCATADPAPILTSDEAVNAVMSMPETRKWAIRMKEITRGTVRPKAMVDHESTGEDDPWRIHVQEDHTSHVATWKRFSVYRSGEIVPDGD